VTAIAAVDHVVRLRLDDGQAVELHALALRDACTCTECRTESGQRLFETHAVVPEAELASVEFDGATLELGWADGHRSSFDREWLAAYAAGPQPARRPTEWGAELDPPAERYDDVAADRASLRRWLAAIAGYGFAVLRGVPLADGAVADVAELFGHVRVTNYGRVFDVSVRVDATNLADTALGLSLHTDNAYRIPPPTVQLLHCLASSASGGETILADGFRAVRLLGAWARSALAARPIRFAYRDGSAELAADVPVVLLDPDGAPAALHLNNRSKGVPAGSPDEVARWYAAYFELLALLEAPEAQVVFRLEPGDLVAFDNTRVLHGRTAFSGEGERRLQGCYADLDGVLSTLAVLSR
jgi:gamma-butyrobetaine dioxygenase